MDDELTLPSGFNGSSTSGPKYEQFKLKNEKDQLILRRLPSMKGLLDTGNIGVYSVLHYGWKGHAVGDPSKTTHRPFVCIEQRQRGGLVTQECPACKLRKEYLDRFEAIKVKEQEARDGVLEKAKKAGVTDESKIAAAISKAIEPLKDEKSAVAGWLKDHGLDRKFKFHAVNKEGKLGIASIPYGMKTKWMEQIKEIETRCYPKSITKGKEVKIQAAGRVGVFFEFNRSGKATNTSDSVAVHRVASGEDGAEVVDFHRASDELLQQAQKVLPCLVEELERLRLSESQIDALVKHAREMGGSSDPDVVDRIMGPRKQIEQSRVASNSNDDFMAEPEPKPEVKAEPEKKAEPVKEAAKEVAKPQESVVNMADASDDEFNALFG